MQSNKNRPGWTWSVNRTVLSVQSQQKVFLLLPWQVGFETRLQLPDRRGVRADGEETQSRRTRDGLTQVQDWPRQTVALVNS